MIIGISGKIGSGKDTVARMIQEIAIKEKNLESQIPVGFPASEQLFEADMTQRSGWQVKKFAGKLKQIVSILTGIPVEDLEKEEVKNQLLPEYWKRWYLFHYKLSSSKNPKGIASNYYASEEEANFDSVLGNLNLSSKIEYPTVRQLLQEVGTEAMRNIIHPNIWVNALMVDYHALDVENSQSMLSEIDYSNCKFPNWLITDVRFPNELQAIKDRNGIVIRIDRKTSVVSSMHPSETSLDNATFDYYISNEGTLEDLLIKTKNLYKEWNLTNQLK